MKDIAVQTARVASIALALAIAGCASSSGDRVTLPGPKANWTNATGVDGLDRKALTNWWMGFNDRELSTLIEEAFLHNPNVRSAAERVRESRANATVASSALWPTINANAASARNKDLSRIPAKPPILDVAQAGVSASWEVDLFGANRAGAQAAERSALAAGELERAVYVALAAEVASTLFTQRSLIAQLRTQQEAVAVSREVWRFALERYRRGLATQFDVDRSWSLTKTLEA
jgi:outer membrane protein, multidrug efflux system